MGRTITTHQTSFTRPGNVTYTFDASRNPLKATTITLPPGSRWTSGLHWHETHTEYLQIIQGVALVTLNGITRNYTAADDIIVVPPFSRHEWQRADSIQPHPDIDLIVREWTDPVDGQKEVFFRNLNSAILDATAAGPPNEFWLTLQLFMVSAVLDNYPVLYSGPRPLRFLASAFEWVVTHAVLFLAMVVGRIFAMSAVYDEYTPRSLRGHNGVRKHLGTSKERIA
jgi:mannose-6-phosphate isomerase-like protein (cupin superfamily)